MSELKEYHLKELFTGMQLTNALLSQIRDLLKITSGLLFVIVLYVGYLFLRTFL